MTTKLKKIPFFGEGIYSKSPVVTRQRRLNCYYDFRKDGDKSSAVLYGTPGLKLKFNITSPNNNPLRGILGCALGLFAVVGNTFYSLDATGTVLHSHTLTTYNGTVQMASNPTQIIVVDGTAGWIYTVSTDTWAQISSNFPNGAQTVVFLNSFFVVESTGTNQFFVSNSGDGTTWNALAFASAAQYPDNLLAVDAFMGMLILHGSNHTEFWQNIGASPEPFQYISNSANEYGLAAVFSRAHVGNAQLFLCVTQEGGYQVAMTTGYQTQVVSTPDIDNIIQSLTVVSDAVAMSYQVDNHSFYQLTFPHDSRSILFDVSTGLWSETQSGITTNYTQRHYGQYSAVYKNVNYVTDYRNGNVYTFDISTYTDNGAVIPREVTTRHAQHDFNRFRVSKIYLDMETGVGLQTGQGSDPQIMMQVSKDNGRTWGNERWAPLGIVGQYNQLVNWRRVAHARDIICRFRMSDPVKFTVTGGAAIVSARQ